MHAVLGGFLAILSVIVIHRLLRNTKAHEEVLTANARNALDRGLFYLIKDTSRHAEEPVPAPRMRFPRATPPDAVMLASRLPAAPPPNAFVDDDAPTTVSTSYVVSRSVMGPVSVGRRVR